MTAPFADLSPELAAFAAEVSSFLRSRRIRGWSRKGTIIDIHFCDGWRREDLAVLRRHVDWRDHMDGALYDLCLLVAEDWEVSAISPELPHPDMIMVPLFMDVLRDQRRQYEAADAFGTKIMMFESGYAPSDVKINDLARYDLVSKEEQK
jgi:hypothetical protein